MRFVAYCSDPDIEPFLVEQDNELDAYKDALQEVGWYLVREEETEENMEEPMR
jgi:hypothetical protein